MGVDNKVVHVGSIGVVIETPGVQDTSHENKNNEYEDCYMRKIADEYIPEEYVHHTQLTPPTEWWIYKPRPINPRSTL